MKTRKLWIGFIAVVTISFAVLIYYGREIYHEAPPIPEKVVAEDGTVLFTRQEIKDGQNVWQSLGGHQLGTIWGHGAYQAPDWTADWLHREAVFILDILAKNSYGKVYDELEEEQRASLKALLQKDLRSNTYDKASGTITVSSVRAEAIANNGLHYGGLFTNDPELAHLREAYAIPENSLKTEERVHQLNAFFFWHHGPV